MSKTSYLDEPADVKAEPGTKTWARGVASKIKNCVSRLDFDVSSVHGWIQIAVEHNAWQVLGYVSLDVFLVAEAGITQEFIDAIRNAKKGTTVGDVKDKVEAAKANPLATEDQKVEPRNPSGRKGKESVDNINRLKGGTDTTYTLRRLARDCPEMLDRIEAGELSVNAAAIQAGIRRKKTPEELVVWNWRKSQSRLVPLKVVVDELQQHELEVVRDWINTKLDVN